MIYITTTIALRGSAKLRNYTVCATEREICAAEHKYHGLHNLLRREHDLR